MPGRNDEWAARARTVLESPLRGVRHGSPTARGADALHAPAIRYDSIPLAMWVDAFHEFTRQRRVWEAAATHDRSLDDALQVGRGLLLWEPTEDLDGFVVPPSAHARPAAWLAWRQADALVVDSNRWLNLQAIPCDPPDDADILEYEAGGLTWADDDGTEFRQTACRTAAGDINQQFARGPQGWNPSSRPLLVRAELDITAAANRVLVRLLAAALRGWDPSSLPHWACPELTDDLSPEAVTAARALAPLFDNGPLARDQIVVSVSSAAAPVAYRQSTRFRSLPAGVSVARCVLTRNDVVVGEVEFATGPAGPTALFLEPNLTMRGLRPLMPLDADVAREVQREIPALRYAISQTLGGAALS